MSFTISEISRTGSEVTYGIYLDPSADPGTAGIDSFTVDLVFESADLTYKLGSASYPAGFTALTNEADAATGTVIFGGFTFSPWTTFTDPLITFIFDITNTDQSEPIDLENIELDGTFPADVNLTIYPDNSAPVGTVTISDTTPAEGQLLTATNNITDADTIPGTISYTWYVDGVETLVDSATYTPVQADVGKVITVIANYTDGDGKPDCLDNACRKL